MSSDTIRKTQIALWRMFSYIFTLLATAMFIFCIVMAFTYRPQDSGAAAGLVAGFFLAALPAAFSIYKLRKGTQEFTIRYRIKSIIESRNKINTEEIADDLELALNTVYALVLELNQSEHFDLVEITKYVFVRRSILTDKIRVIRQCASCGASLGKKILISGEACIYCGTLQL